MRLPRYKLAIHDPFETRRRVPGKMALRSRVTLVNNGNVKQSYIKNIGLPCSSRRRHASKYAEDDDRIRNGTLCDKPCSICGFSR